MNRTRFLDPGGTEVGRGFSSADDLPGSEGLDERYQPLQRLTRHRRHLVKTLVREKQVAWATCT